MTGLLFQYFVFSYRIIRRRIIWLLGCWVGVKFSPQMRPALYEVIVPFLSTGDLVVRLEAAFSLRSDILFLYFTCLSKCFKNII